MLQVLVYLLELLHLLMSFLLYEVNDIKGKMIKQGKQIIIEFNYDYLIDKVLANLGIQNLVRPQAYNFKMLTEQEKKFLPIIHHFETEKFNVKLELTFTQDSKQLFIIELSHKLHENEVHICQIDLEKIRSNGHLHLFQRPSNLFLEMTAVLDQIKISDYGEIEFYMSLGKKSKFPVTLFATRKGVDSEDYLKKQEELLRNMELNCNLKQKYCENSVLIMKKIAQLNRLMREVPEMKKELDRVMWQYTLQEKNKQQYELVRQGLQRALKKEAP